MSPELIAAIIAASVSLLTLIVSVTAQIYGIRRTSADTVETLKTQSEQLEGTFKARSEQLERTLQEQNRQVDKTLAEQRTRTLNERFSTAVDKLGSDKPPAVRLAGVYAMAGLADDWPKNRQTCIEVLCGYLRLPYELDPGGQAPADDRLRFRADLEVRHTVIRSIASRLRKGAPKSWQGLDFDFTGAVLDGADFRLAEFSGGTVDFTYAKFIGHEPVREEDGSYILFTGFNNFSRAKFSGSKVVFNGTEFSSGVVNFADAEFSGGTVDFALAKFSGGEVGFEGAKFSGGEVGFEEAEFSGGEVGFNEAEFSGSQVYFMGARFSGGRVNFDRAKFSGGRVDFERAVFSGSQVSLIGAKSFGGSVDFHLAGDWSTPPTFDWDGPPLGVTLP